jgi:1-acyl-sn-glycerol-3-phosphate acyltransferase
MATLHSIGATIAGYTVLLFGTITFGLAAVMTAWIPPPGATMTWCARTWSRCWLAASGVRVRASLPPEVEPGEGYVFLANHCSWYDIPALLSSLPGRVRFAAKRGLFQVPFLGWAMKSGGFLPVDRQDRSRAREAFAVAVEELGSGGSVLFFPEGTRSPDGQLLPFQRGGFLLALKSGLRVVPVGVRGSFEVMPRSSFRVRPGVIHVRFGEPLDPAEYGLRGRKELMEEVRRRIEGLTEPAIR